MLQLLNLTVSLYTCYFIDICGQIMKKLPKDVLGIILFCIYFGVIFVVLVDMMTSPNGNIFRVTGPF